jgi:hypothetical protein
MVKAVPLNRPSNTIVGGRGIVPTFLNLSVRRGCFVKATPRPLYPRDPLMWFREINVV